MKTFLVPLDFSAVSGTVVDTAVEFSRNLGGRIVMLHIIQPPAVTGDYALPVEVLQEAAAASEKSARGHLGKYEEKCRAAGIGVETVIRQGAPVPLILEEAGNRQADFIIMGSHGHGKLYDFLVGSTASGIIKKARCGVIILPPADKHG